LKLKVNLMARRRREDEEEKNVIYIVADTTP
jgi:hypothetical protein